MRIHNFISKPVHSIKGEITVPGDKSISHRSIIFGSIAKGTTIINGFLDGDDCMATLKAFQAMGVTIEGPDEQQVVIYGVGKHGLQKPEKIVDCGNSGTSMRLLAGLLTAQSFDSQLTGDESLLKRPMLRVSKPLTQMGADITTVDGKPPITIKGGKNLKGIHYVMPEASAQVKSCILLAGLYAEGETRIIEIGVSRDHTELMLKNFSYPVHRSDNTLIINSANECIGTEIYVPGDISSAAFFIVAATIIPGSDILIRNVGINPTRSGIIHILLEMGANITLLDQRQLGEEWVADLRIKYTPLKGIKIEANMVPLAIDEFPVIFIAAACAQGQTTLHGASELRFKESDRIAAMVDGLKKLGIHAQALDDGIIIEGGTLHGGTVESRGDHRIAMSFAIAGAVASDPVTIKNCVNVATSFPLFVETAKELQLQIEETVDNVQ
ncbi:3-phosphoshikimate 1-carboxyvinyltransferase [Legionella tucsonensis]|uniref:3-phosphoshikimate 1-carboxyvinyltransferase n=1 Tax=Legionella tucsonensis TaxID=40335 RepID=A0A0W0ZVM4_9GAMM|nr:3-phosphoshikimate 1-carboxyvinyltransferase [Legionella tucsonensis]KTD73154.1 3-phosphoshikimate 1-carboxyvinyltransferase [Legionella tucsonensis]